MFYLAPPTRAASSSLCLSSKAPLTEGPFRPAAIILFRLLRALPFLKRAIVRCPRLQSCSSLCDDEVNLGLFLRACLFI